MHGRQLAVQRAITKFSGGEDPSLLNKLFKEPKNLALAR